MLCRSHWGRQSCPALAIVRPRFALALVALLAASSAFGGERDAPLKISIVEAQFRHVPAPLVKLSFRSVQALVKSQTTLDSEFQLSKDANVLAQQLADDQVDLGVFHGVEFAWVRQKHKDLRPLVIVVNGESHVRAHLLVAKDSPVSQFADLHGKALAMANGTRLHCRLFVERPCQDCGQEPEKFFSRITTPANVEDALDDVVDGTVAAAVADGVALDCYKRRKPGRFAKLRELVTAEAFPCPVIAYRAGHLDGAILQRFKEDLTRAGEQPAAKRVLMLWKITGFEAIPANYERSLTEIAKAYPAPEEEKSANAGRRD